jgi:hypothetical protein
LKIAHEEILGSILPVFGYEVLAIAGLPQHTEQHIATMSQLHLAYRYDRATTDVERITGKPPLTVEEFVAARKDLHLE